MSPSVVCIEFTKDTCSRMNVYRLAHQLFQHLFQVFLGKLFV